MIELAREKQACELKALKDSSDWWVYQIITTGLAVHLLALQGFCIV